MARQLSMLDREQLWEADVVEGCASQCERARKKARR